MRHPYQSAIVEVAPSQFYLVHERGDTIKPEPRHWMLWSMSYGPFDSVSSVRAQIQEWFKPYIGLLSPVHPLQKGAFTEDSITDPEIRMTIVMQAHEPLPTGKAAPKKERKEATVDFRFWDVECECGSMDLDGLESLDIIATQNPNGPWLLTCNECGAELDVFDQMSEGMGN